VSINANIEKESNIPKSSLDKLGIHHLLSNKDVNINNIVNSIIEPFVFLYDFIVSV
jgi:hypothetical protein